MNPLDQMWQRLEQHQEHADTEGYGKQWAKMCRDRSTKATAKASDAARKRNWAAGDAAFIAHKTLVQAEEGAYRVLEMLAIAKVEKK